jgi:hypothetical protein
VAVWPTVIEEGFSNLRTQLQSRIPVRVVEQMEVREMHASRFVSLLVGRTDKPVRLKPSRRVRHSLTTRRLNRLERRLEVEAWERRLREWALSDLPSDQWSRPTKG